MHAQKHHINGALRAFIAPGRGKNIPDPIGLAGPQLGDGGIKAVKPIIIADIKGQNYAYKKVKGTTNARIAIAEHIKDAADGNYETLYISHADCEEDAIKLRDEILKIADFKEVKLGYIGPIVGASVGPGTVIAFCYGKEVTIEGNE